MPTLQEIVTDLNSLNTRFNALLKQYNAIPAAKRPKLNLTEAQTDVDLLNEEYNAANEAINGPTPPGPVGSG